MQSNLHRLAPVLYVGSGGSPVVTRLRDLGVRVIVAERPERGLRLLQQFVVGGVIYDVTALRPVLDFVALRTPVVLLAAGKAWWGTPDVQIIPREARAETIVEALASTRESAAVA